MVHGAAVAVAGDGESSAQVNSAKLEGNNMGQNLDRMKLFNARRKFKSAIQTVIVAGRLRKFVEGIESMP